jgi:hypothetical protein
MRMLPSGSVTTPGLPTEAKPLVAVVVVPTAPWC